MNPDYSQLYRSLGLQPGCSLDALRQAYRRHVGNQHPDRGEAVRPQSDMSLPLPEVIALYDQAIRFHRRYGRLPGTTPLSHPSATDVAAPASSSVPGGARARAHATLSSTGGSRWWLLLVVLVLLLLASYTPWQAPQTHAPQQVAPAASASPSRTEALPGTLALGMDVSTVLAIQGEPFKRREDQWEYGPSWIRFEKGRLSDWYSSPFYRLKTATPIPQAAKQDE